jgi:hypothetical protein
MIWHPTNDPTTLLVLGNLARRRSMKNPLLVSVLVAICAISVGSEVLNGEPSLQGYPVQTQGFLNATASAANSLERHLDIWMALPNSTAPIEQYQTEMTKIWIRYHSGSDHCDESPIR